MAAKTSYYTTICLLLLLLLLSYLHISHGAEDSQVYDIDYRGPETHPSVAPPSHFHKRPWARRRDFTEPPAALTRGRKEKLRKSRDDNGHGEQMSVGNLE